MKISFEIGDLFAFEQNVCKYQYSAYFVYQPFKHKCE